MRVTLAYPYKDYIGGATVDLPRSEARNLIAIGRAREAEEIEESGQDEDISPGTQYLINMQSDKDEHG